MAGGIVLMGILSWILPIPTAMVMHGYSQFFANGSRSVLNFKDIYWSCLIYYFIGALFGGVIFYTLNIVPDRTLVFLLLGIIPFIRYLKFIPVADITKPFHSAVCGLSIIMTQLLAGASGPILDYFFVQTRLNRYEIVATKAITQTISHCLKIIYFLMLSQSLTDLDSLFSSQEMILLFICIPILSYLGTYLGGLLLNRFSDDLFKRYNQYLMQIIGILYLFKALNLYFS